MDVAELVRETGSLIEPLAKSRGLEFSCSTPDRLMARTDAGKLRQIVLNLLSNAIKFTDHGAIHVALAEREGAVTLEVRDTGIGIPAADRERVFEPFTQVEQDRTRRAGGTGLGLSVTRQLARLMGGDVAIDSEPGVGSTFRVAVPVRLQA